jgi:hypothetical protein
MAWPCGDNRTLSVAAGVDDCTAVSALRVVVAGGLFVAGKPGVFFNVVSLIFTALPSLGGV